MNDKIEVKLVEISETLISIQNQNATLADHLVEIDEKKLADYKRIQREFNQMQNELLALIDEI